MEDLFFSQAVCFSVVLYVSFFAAFTWLDRSYKAMKNRILLAAVIMLTVFGSLFQILVAFWGPLWSFTFASIGLYFAVSRILIGRTKAWQKWHVRRAFDASVIGFIVMFSVCKHGDEANRFPQELEQKVPQSKIEALAFDTIGPGLSPAETARREDLQHKYLFLERLIAWQWCLQSLGSYVVFPACLVLAIGQTFESARSSKESKEPAKTVSGFVPVTRRKEKTELL